MKILITLINNNKEEILSALGKIVNMDSAILVSKTGRAISNLEKMGMPFKVL